MPSQVVYDLTEKNDSSLDLIEKNIAKNDLVYVLAEIDIKGVHRQDCRRHAAHHSPLYQDKAVTPTSLEDIFTPIWSRPFKGGVDLATRRPYPNKRYAVACRREGRKAIDGILIETSAPVQEMHYTARWAIQAAFVAIHEVHYTLLDYDFDAASYLKILSRGCRDYANDLDCSLPRDRSVFSLVSTI